MKQRYIEILKILDQSSVKYISGNDLARYFAVTTRTIRNDIKDINDHYLEDNLIQSTSKGYKLAGTYKLNTEDGFLEIENRYFFIVRMLLEQSEEAYVTYEYLAKKLYFSTQTIRKDVQQLFKIIQEEHPNLKMEAVIFQGIKLSGDEVSKRLLLSSLLPEKDSMNAEVPSSILDYLENWISTEEFSTLKNIIQIEVDKKEIILTEKETFTILIHVIISMKRMRLNKFITPQNLKLETVNTNEILLASAIMNHVCKLVRVEYNEYEAQYLSYLLVTLQIFSGEVFNHYDLSAIHEPDARIDAILKRAEKRFDLRFSEDKQFYHNFYHHIDKLINPLKYNFPIDNPFISQIKNEYLHAYNISVVIAKEIQKEFKINVPENEIGYLTLHVANYQEKFTQTENSVAIVYGKNSNIGKFIEKRLKFLLPHLEIKGIYSINELKEIPDYIEFIISNIKIPEINSLQKVKTIYVEETFDERDIKKISMQLNRGILENFLDKDDFFFTEENNRENLLQSITRRAGIDHLLESILDREEMSDTSIGHYAALPHPFEGGNNEQLRVIVALNSKPIPWGEHSVQLVFLFLPPKDARKNYNKFFTEIHEVLSIQNHGHDLINANNFEEFLDIWNAN